MERETSCINARAVLDYMKEHYKGDIASLIDGLDPELDDLVDPESFLRDPNNWISCAVLSRLYEMAGKLLDDKNVAFKIGRYAAEKTSLGYAQRIFVKAFWSYKTALKHAQKINDKWNRSKTVELVEFKGNGAVVRLHWDPNMHSTKDICLYYQGASSSLPVVWGGRPLALKEKCCYFEGAPYCEYYVSWPLQNRFHEIFSRFFTTKSVLMDTITEMEQDKKIIEEKYKEVNRLNEVLNRKVKQLMAIQETGKAILSLLDLENLLGVIMTILTNICQIDRAIIMLTNEAERCLQFIHGVGYPGEIPDEIKNYKVPLDRLNNILARVANTGKSEYIPDVANSSLRKKNIMLIYGKPTSVFVVPLITRSKVIGVIATDAAAGKGVPPETRETLEIFSSQIAVAIENARLYSRLQEQVAETKRSHALLLRMEKFSFLGNLAARLAHEIKNPMTAIGTFFQMLPKKFDDEEFRTEFYSIAMEETNRINRMISELLDLVKPKESHFEQNNLHALIEKMILLISPQSKSKHIDIITDFDPDIGDVRMDYEKMKQVILNILSNAVDFTPRKGRIEIRTTKYSEGNGQRIYKIEIKDNGCGIPQDMINKVFDPYFTTKHKSNIHNGTGLGLFIAHQIMQDHSGTIEIKSDKEDGTHVILSLPSDPEPASPTLYES